MLDEVAIQRELADERIDLPKRQRRPALQIAAHKAVARGTDFERRLGSLFDRWRAVFLGELQDAEDATNRRWAVIAVDDLLRQAKIGAETTRAGLTFYLAAGALYLLLTGVSDAAREQLERRAQRGMARG